MEWLLAVPAIVLLTVGFVGQAFEMRKIKIITHGNDLGSPNIFLDRRNFKWYAMIGIAIVLWYVSGRM
ncbi:MAG: hypothetical protein OXC46_01990 [Thaumarchaeota archaeon]|nr:hypothetical protein [Nitrososphaerota archaeon]